MACKDYETIQDIIAFSKSAAVIYDKLAEMEYNGLVGSKEYFECIDFLRSIREYEDRRWKNLKLNTEYFNTYISFFVERHKLILQDLLFVLDINNPESAVENKRFVSFAQSIAAKRNESLCAVEFVGPELEEYKKQLEEKYGCEVEIVTPEEEGIEDIDDILDQQDLEDEKIRNDVELKRDEALSHTFLYYLQEEINKCNDEETKKYLLKTKYRCICVNEALEKWFLDRAPNFLMPKLFQRCVEVDINNRKNAYQEVYVDFLKADIEESLKEFDDIQYTELPLEQGGGRALLESIYTRACNSVNPSFSLATELEILKQNALKRSQTDYAKKKILDSFKLNKELTMTKNVDL